MPAHSSPCRPCLLGNTVATAANTDIATTKESMSTLTEEIAALTAGIKALDGSVAEATQERQDENAEYKALVASDTAANYTFGAGVHTHRGDRSTDGGHQSTGRVRCRGHPSAMDIRSGLPVYLFWGDGTPRTWIPSA